MFAIQEHRQFRDVLPIAFKVRVQIHILKVHLFKGIRLNIFFTIMFDFEEHRQFRDVLSIAVKVRVRIHIFKVLSCKGIRLTHFTIMFASEEHRQFRDVLSIAFKVRVRMHMFKVHSFKGIRLHILSTASVLPITLRGGGLGSSPIFKNLMSPTPRRKWYLTTGRRAH